MIKAEISEKKKEPVNEYPKLMIHQDGSIVLFIEYGAGTILFNARLHGMDVGKFSPIWVMENFTDFHGSITLSNEELTK